ncbi:hypothetical protein DUI87_34807 [Hirundo rustica rustica]|uniref:HSF-type DNA-binding domain-containing protein n=1 Tax=Hirundo rustica rustica TaxID=333673 RepID=A0A3M0IQR8_HIRRU|nr:hypothetical protein DUI87_34807 [Hirundo rustica rustica]
MDAMAQLPLPAGLGASTFPAKLWSLVNDPRVCSLRWDSEARGLLVDRSLFERELLRPGGAQGPAPNAFRATQFRSFVRQLYRYGFRRVPGRAGAAAPGDAGAWLHYRNPCRSGHFSPTCSSWQCWLCSINGLQLSAECTCARGITSAGSWPGIEKMIREIRNSLPVKAPSAQDSDGRTVAEEMNILQLVIVRISFCPKGNINVAPESPREDPMNRAAAEEVSSGTESCGNSSPEPEEPVQVVSSCDLLSNGESMDPMVQLQQVGISSPSSRDPELCSVQRCHLDHPEVLESQGIMVEQMKLYLGHTSVEGPPKYIRYDQEALEHKVGYRY